MQSTRSMHPSAPHQPHTCCPPSRAVQTVMHTLRSLLNSPRVLAGCGAAEVHAAAHIRASATAVRTSAKSSDTLHASHMQVACEAFASALEATATDLAHGAADSGSASPRVAGPAAGFTRAASSADVLERLTRANHSTLCSASHGTDTSPQAAHSLLRVHGWDATRGCVVPVMQRQAAPRSDTAPRHMCASCQARHPAGATQAALPRAQVPQQSSGQAHNRLVVDAAVPKAAAIAAAVEAATALLRVHGTVVDVR